MQVNIQGSAETKFSPPVVFNRPALRQWRRAWQHSFRLAFVYRHQVLIELYSDGTCLVENRYQSITRRSIMPQAAFAGLNDQPKAK